MVYKHQASCLETGGRFRAVTPDQLTFTNVFEVRSVFGGQVRLVFQPFPYGALIVVREGGLQILRMPLLMEHFQEGIASEGTPLRVHGEDSPG